MNIQLIITLDQATGQIQVQGPIENAMLVYGMLEAAKDAIREFKANQKNGLVAIHGPLPSTNGKGN